MDRGRRAVRRPVSTPGGTGAAGGRGLAPGRTGRHRQHAGTLHRGGRRPRYVSELRPPDSNRPDGVRRRPGVPPRQRAGRPPCEPPHRPVARVARSRRAGPAARLRGTHQPAGSLSGRPLPRLDARAVAAACRAGHGLAAGARQRLRHPVAHAVDGSAGVDSVERRPVLHRRPAAPHTGDAAPRPAEYRHSAGATRATSSAIASRCRSGRN